MRLFINLILVLTALGLVACNSGSGSKADAVDPNGTLAQPDLSDGKSNYVMSGIPFDLNGTPAAIAGVTFTPASQWTDLGPSGMRKASYTFGPLDKDADSATMTVFYFGATGGGSIDDNLNRWIGQMSMPDGSEPGKAAIKYEIKVDGMTAHILSVYGTYNVSVGGMMSTQTVPKESYRLIGAVVEAPEGNLFFKLTGPEYTARIMTEAFMTMVKAIKRSDVDAG